MQKRGFYSIKVRSLTEAGQLDCLKGVATPRSLRIHEKKVKWQIFRGVTLIAFFLINSRSLDKIMIEKLPVL